MAKRGGSHPRHHARPGAAEKLGRHRATVGMWRRLGIPAYNAGQSHQATKMFQVLSENLDTFARHHWVS